MMRNDGKRAGIVQNTAGLLILLILLALLPAASAGGEAAEALSYRVEECSLERDSMHLFGELYLPEGAEGPLPLVILCHGLGSNHEKMVPYAEFFAENDTAAYVFDFIGGSEVSRSDGKMTEMSVLTEAEDLDAVIDYFRGDERFAEGKLFLFGGSQGGMICLYTAGKRPGDIAGLVALYPALNLQDICRQDTANGVPDTVQIRNHIVGSVYLKDMLTFDIYEVMKNYTGPVLLMHGTADPMVPVSYAEKAAEVLSDAELIILEGAGHGFKGADLERAANDALRFIRGEKPE